jgi:hypothetical protein
MLAHDLDKKKRWDEFTVFVLAHGKYSKDLETVVQRLSDPRKNIQRGRFHPEADLRGELGETLRFLPKVVGYLNKREAR